VRLRLELRSIPKEPACRSSIDIPREGVCVCV
jgi:hypothetical protein